MSGLPSDELIKIFYDELRTIAKRERHRAGSPQTLQTTALINQAYIRLRGDRRWESRSHFLGFASTAMRHILIDAARSRLAAKRAGQHEAHSDLSEFEALSHADDAELVALGDALAMLAKRDPRLAQVVDCRFFAGLDERETGLVLGVTDRTVRRLWVQARAILYAEMAVT